MADDLPARLRAARAFADLTQPELSEAIELGKEGVTYAETERGRRDLSGPELLAIADVTGAPRWFLEGGWENYPGAAAIGPAEDAGEDDQAREASREAVRRQDLDSAEHESGRDSSAGP